MIALADSVTSQWRDLYRTPPTHARLVQMRDASMPREGIPWLDAHRATLAAYRQIDVFYAFGTIEGEGDAFVPHPAVPPVHAIVFADGPSGARTRSDPSPLEPAAVTAHRDALRQYAAAVDNLLGGGVVPHPERPYEGVPVPALPPGEWRTADLDAVVAFIEPRLAGRVVPDPPSG